jgi:MoaA/NifB/PqqE/SkfB family radical SAM enzyme
MVPEYIPWSKNTLSDCLNLQSKGFLPTLDLELTAKCSECSCIYCDSKPEVSSSIDFQETGTESILHFISECIPLGLKWVYTCGLGEPLEDDKFWDVLHFLSAHDIKLSMFSNGVVIKDVNTARELKKNGVSIILKMDTFDERQFDKILGRTGAANKIYAARDYLLSAGYAQNPDYTDFAFSIVPTSISLQGIPAVIAFCKKYNIFASIGELERAGEVVAKNLSPVLGLSEKEVNELKKLADIYYEGCYMRPICPCILTGLHIDNRGDVIVDRITGLNCKWFLLSEPDIYLIGNICGSSASDLFAKVNDYRERAFHQNREIIDSSSNVSYVFGGCGGNPRDILKLARERQI